jgi:hypothetical protein
MTPERGVPLAAFQPGQKRSRGADTLQHSAVGSDNILRVYRAIQRRAEGPPRGLLGNLLG